MKQINRNSSVMIALSLSVLLTACTSTKEAAPTTTTPAPNTTAPTAPATDNKPADPLGKYSPTIEVSTIRSIDASYKFAAGESLDKNIWTPIMENELGIKVKNLWVVDGSQFSQKLNVTLASGELPDFMAVDRVVMQRLIDSNLVEDMTTIYDKYATPFTKEALLKDGGAALKSVTVNGKLMGIPQMFENNGVASASMVWIRTDWMKKLGLAEPKTMEDVLNIATAFAKNDPDGNGKADTIGLGISKDLFKESNNGVTPASLIGLFNAYHAYPTFWVKDASGKLVYGSVQPEMKPALEKLQQLYKDGVIDKEFSVKPWKKVGEDAAAGKLGMAFGYVADATTFFKDNRKNDPKADWQAYPILSADSKPVILQANDAATTFFVVKKGSKNPEAVVKLLNLYNKHYFQTDYSKSKNPFVIDTATSIFPAKYFPVLINPVDLNINAHLKVAEEVKNKGDGSKLDFPASLHFGRVDAFRKGDDSMWFSERTFGPEGAFAVIATYMKNKNYQFNAFTGAPTATMVEKDATLQKIQNEMVTKVIMGAAPISDFDKFVAEWKSLGGDAIEKEVNDYYNKNK
ncbi:extracellular solute-binding protein [Paenibacillus agricola]|uniref:Extracellular solute-binding protein n=1 Tax=Paenibacillus agricola TaxID=2716264 RepID=A0ABX0J6K2_9BACL|nr:extracellular solute-binding protein [Paenibacillus agricola]NHN30799.1 extracellular solute-binding protein [Paenibacillus agricola]